MISSNVKILPRFLGYLAPQIFIASREKQTVKIEESLKGSETDLFLVYFQQDHGVNWLVCLSYQLYHIKGPQD